MTMHRAYSLQQGPSAEITAAQCCLRCVHREYRVTGRSRDDVSKIVSPANVSSSKCGRLLYIVALFMEACRS